MSPNKKKNRKVKIDGSEQKFKKGQGQGSDVEIYDSEGKLLFPLIKGYDDYDRVLRELLGDNAEHILSQAQSRVETPESMVESVKVASERDMQIE